MGCKFGAGKQSMGGAFEINVWQEILVVGCGLTAGIRHRKKRDFVASGSHQVHELEHVNFGAAERKIVFIAVKNSHMSCSPGFGWCVRKGDRRRLPGSFRG